MTAGPHQAVAADLAEAAVAVAALVAEAAASGGAADGVAVAVTK